jgi:hypothetical protein
MMKKNIILGILPGILLMSFACDTDLFKTKDEGQDPVAGEIQADVANFETTVGDTVSFWISASDPDGGTLHYLWEKTGGEFISTPDGETVLWRTVKGGDYTLYVTISNKNKSVLRSKIIRVKSFDKPVVRILSPRAGAYLIQYKTYTILTEAYHDNGISRVTIYINDTFAGICTPKQPSLFQLNWKASEESGQIEIRAEAEAQSTAAVDEDSLYVSIEGVIPGKQ